MTALPNAPAADTGTRFIEMIFPEQANHYGTLFGGAALSLMGKAAFVAATRRARTAVVMASSDKVDFHLAVRVGELVEIDARVARVGRSSMTVEVDVVAEALLTGERRLAMHGSFEMVAVNSEGRPVPIPGAVTAAVMGSDPQGLTPSAPRSQQHEGHPT